MPKRLFIAVLAGVLLLAVPFLQGCGGDCRGEDRTFSFELERTGSGAFVLRGGGSAGDGGVVSVEASPGDTCGDICWSYVRLAEAPEGDISVRSCDFVVFEDGTDGAGCVVDEAETCPGYVPGA